MALLVILLVLLVSSTALCEEDGKTGSLFRRSTTTTVKPGTRRTCDCSCGLRNEGSRIVGGEPTFSNEFPWMVRLSYFNRFYCGGMLINDKYVLTAAHCVRGRQTTKSDPTTTTELNFSSSSLAVDQVCTLGELRSNIMLIGTTTDYWFMWFMIKVTFGEHDRCNSPRKPETRFVIRAFTGDFSYRNFDNDIALLRLNDRVPLTDTIRPICLPKDVDDTYDGVQATVTGWGTLKEDGKPSCILQEVEVPVMSNDDCRANTSYSAKVISDNMMCAGYEEGMKDSCQGDSGGPLVKERDDKRYELIGIVSWGNGCARPGYPGVYTRVTPYVDWILANSADGCFCRED